LNGSRRPPSTRFTSRRIFGGLPSSTSIGMSMAAFAARTVLEHQLLLLGGRADDREGTALALAQLLELGSESGRDRQDVAFLAFVAPDLLGREAGSPPAAPCAGRSGRRGPAPSTSSGKALEMPPAPTSWIARIGFWFAQSARSGDDLVRAPLDLGIAALHGVEVEFRGVGMPAAIELAAPPPMPMRMPGPPSWISSVPAPKALGSSGRSSMVPTPPAIMIGLW
jgi:hypothetical protein